ncbi:MAG: leucine--tRNA ligase, partial [Phycisphaerae bacterium]|nr:leucine--tRNA ligase [Phycisphaerae bacterium]
MPSVSAANSTQNETPFRYTAELAGHFERAWQNRWESLGTFTQANPGDAGFDAKRPKFYCLDMFPYPSGSGLHVGHPVGYIATDIICRYKRMKGFNVLHPMGWDAFGLPAEQYAVTTNVHPSVTTRKAIDTFRKQLKSFGFCYDWSREFATIDPEYYRWTQWIWLQAYDSWYDKQAMRARPIHELVDELDRGVRTLDAAHPDRTWAALTQDQRRAYVDSRRLAYLGEQTVNWCPKLGTVLANEEVIGGKSERGGFPVLRLPLRQWMFRITEYADRLLNDLALVQWPESTRTQQAEWIGRSEGAEILFDVEGASPLSVFTTRPDTIFGATYMVVAPEHPLVEHALKVAGADPSARAPAAHAAARAQADALRAYREAARNRSDFDRQSEGKVKTGVFTGLHAVNPATGERIPIWTADYVLLGYGTGAIMAVPAHDERDLEFARTFDLPVRQVVEIDGTPWTGEHATAGDGTAVNSASAHVSLDGKPTADAKRAIIEWLETSGRGARRVNYKLRDGLFSRQRYWGEPFPVVKDAAGNCWPVRAEALPVTLPELADFKPVESNEPQPPLARAKEWVATTAGAAGVDPALLAPDTPVWRETNTMPNWAGSCWYYLRYCDPRNRTALVGRDAERYWMLSRKGKHNGEGEGKDERGATERPASFDAATCHSGGVDLYVGGNEHAVLHLLYARFWHKVLFDLGHVSTPEPFGKLFHQGMLLSHAYQRPDGSLVAVDLVEERAPSGGSSAPTFVETSTGQPVQQIVAKMSKSLRNVINPDDVIAEYGADTFRLYEMYMGPLEAAKPWNTRDIVGVFRFLQRVWRLAVCERTGDLLLASAPDAAIEKALHRTIAKVGDDIERLSLNTAIAAMIELVNAATRPTALADATQGGMTRDQLGRFVRVLAPFAPHMAEELWSKLQGAGAACVSTAEWPTFDAAQLTDAEVEIAVQVLGKVRGRITVPTDADEQMVRGMTLALPYVTAATGGKE